MPGLSVITLLLTACAEKQKYKSARQSGKVAKTIDMDGISQFAMLIKNANALKNEKAKQKIGDMAAITPQKWENPKSTVTKTSVNKSFVHEMSCVYKNALLDISFSAVTTAIIEKITFAQRIASDSFSYFSSTLFFTLSPHTTYAVQR
ncbi:MAG: hypothetical protein E7656_00430 [Ruminococcaceae bacterium]|nr:hypothetical protein [Oscillospiraceae bacterium]